MNALLPQVADALSRGTLRVVDLTQPLGPSTPVIGLPPGVTCVSPASLPIASTVVVQTLSPSAIRSTGSCEPIAVW